jgi:hypothetical protein
VSREVKRVPLDFDWPRNEVWKGYTYTDEEHERWTEDPCPDCTQGWSPRAQHLYDQWYGNAPFEPEDNGSTPLTPWTPAVHAFAKRNVTRDEDSLRFYVGSNRDEYFIQSAIEREAQRLADMWNGQWAHHLSAQDVEDLRAADRLPRSLTHRFTVETRWQPIEPAPVITAEMLNELRITNFFDGHVDPYAIIEARCEREGVPSTCSTCGGHASLERFPGQRAEADAWERTEPPTGEGWQLWETVSEGSPVSRVFRSAEGLAQWLTSGIGTGTSLHPNPLTIEQARGFVGVGYSLGTFVRDAGGLHDGAEYVGTLAALEGHEQELDG